MRSYTRGSERYDVELVDTTISTRRFAAGVLVGEDTHACSSTIVAKWDFDRTCRDLIADGYVHASGDDGIVSVSQRELVAALAAAPDELDTYLVYADWLSERGDPWGQLIAVQHALATLRRPAPADRRDELERAETMLRFQHSARLWGALGETIVNEEMQRYACDLIDATWHCGFVRAAAIRDPSPELTATLVRALASLEIATLLRSLALVRLDVRDRAIETLAEHTWPMLEQLEISGEMFAYRESHALDGARIATLLDGRAMPALLDLNVAETRDTDAICIALAASPLASRLRTLTLYLGELTDVGIAALRDARFPALRDLRLTGQGPPNAHRQLAKLATRVDVRLTLQHDPDDG